MDLAALQAQLLAERQELLEELGIGGGPVAMPQLAVAPARRRTSNRTSEKQRRAAARSAAKLAKAAASGKTRKRLGANLKLLEAAGKLHSHLRRGAPLTSVEGVGYHKPEPRRRTRSNR